ASSRATALGLLPGYGCSELVLPTRSLHPICVTATALIHSRSNGASTVQPRLLDESAACDCCTDSDSLAIAFDPPDPITGIVVGYCARCLRSSKRLDRSAARTRKLLTAG